MTMRCALLVALLVLADAGLASAAPKKAPKDLDRSGSG